MPTRSGVALDASYDWHVLMLVPFDTLLKASPIALHEVLLFHDESHGSADVDAKDCYTADGAPPRFVDRRPDPYLLCFQHDHLQRIEASVHLGADEATQVFARACALWLKDPALQPAGTACEGRDGGIAFSAHLGAVPGEPTVTLSITLSDTALRDTAHDP